MSAGRDSPIKLDFFNRLQQKTAQTNALGSYTIYSYCSCGISMKDQLEAIFPVEPLPPSGAIVLPFESDSDIEFLMFGRPVSLCVFVPSCGHFILPRIYERVAKGVQGRDF